MKESWNIWHPIKKIHQLAIYNDKIDSFVFADDKKLNRQHVLFCSPTERQHFENWFKQNGNGKKT